MFRASLFVGTFTSNGLQPAEASPSLLSDSAQEPTTPITTATAKNWILNALIQSSCRTPPSIHMTATQTPASCQLRTYSSNFYSKLLDKKFSRSLAYKRPNSLLLFGFLASFSHLLNRQGQCPGSKISQRNRLVLSRLKIGYCLLRCTLRSRYRLVNGLSKYSFKALFSNGLPVGRKLQSLVNGRPIASWSSCVTSVWIASYLLLLVLLSQP